MSHKGFGLPDGEPEFQVWNHLHTGLDYARGEFDVLDDHERAIIESVASFIVSSRLALAAEKEIAEALEVQPELLENPWFRHAADLELARAAIGRASDALERYIDLMPVASSYQVGPKPAEYFAEVAQTFVYGFDSACIALAGAAIEQVLKDVLVTEGHYTEEQIKRERPSGTRVLNKAKAEELVSKSYSQAKAALEHRNQVMHSHMWDVKVRRKIALSCIGALLGVVAELK